MGQKKETPLHVAVQRGHTERTRRSLDQGADINAVNKMGDTLHEAIGETRTELAHVLLDRGAKVIAVNKQCEVQKKLPICLSGVAAHRLHGCLM